VTQQGWYPDPGGAFGMYRYWDGVDWSETTSPTPLPGPPAPGPHAMSGPGPMSGPPQPSMPGPGAMPGVPAPQPGPPGPMTPPPGAGFAGYGAGPATANQYGGPAGTPYGTQNPTTPPGTQTPGSTYGTQNPGSTFGTQNPTTPFGPQTSGTPFGTQTSASPFGTQTPGTPPGYGQPGYGQPGYGQPGPGKGPGPKRPPLLWVGLAVGLLAVAVIVFFTVRALTGSSPDPTPTTTTSPTQAPTPKPTPTPTPTPSPTPPPNGSCPPKHTDDKRANHPNDKFVYGGHLAYPKLGGNWSKVITDTGQLPFARDAASQIAVVHTNNNPGNTTWKTWSATVYVGELALGNKLPALKDAVASINKCIFDTFYGQGTKVTTQSAANEAATIDGQKAWFSINTVSFKIPDLPTTAEVVTVIVVQTSSTSASVFVASIPNDAQDLMKNISDAIKGIKVVT